MVHSALDGISGLGPARQARLVESAGSLEAVRSMSLEELLAITWLPHDVANRLYDALHGPSEGEGPIDG
jgi:excinuclease ABC subunit C